MDDYIIIEGLTKSYDGKIALDNLNLKVSKGEVFGFLGPNGAGKTTTIRMMTTLTKPSSGKVLINGLDVVRNPKGIKSLIGVVQQHSSLDRDLTVKENIIFHARLNQIPASEREWRISELVKYVELEEHVDKMVDSLSGGLKRKVSIVCALIRQPEVLFLDEPTVGLDAQSRRKLWDLVRRLNRDGTTIFLTTHYIEEAQALCDRVGIIDCGSLIALGTPLELRQSLGMVTVETLNGNYETDYHYFSDRVEATSHVQGLTQDSDTIIIRDSNLEDVFVELTGKKVGGS